MSAPVARASTHGVALPGLSGDSPLGFLAALGVLRVLGDASGTSERPRLSWSGEGPWTPLVSGPDSIDSVVDAVLDDCKKWRDEPGYLLAYDKHRALVEADAEGAIRDLKASPASMRMFLEQVAGTTAGQRTSRSSRLAAAFASDAVANKSRTKVIPTAFHFTSGNQKFLGVADEIRDALTRDDLVEALLGPWRRASEVKSFGWDPLGSFASRLYALRASAAGTETRTTVPGAEWLAFLGLSFFPAVPVGAHLHTTAVHRRGRIPEFRWPIWDSSASADAIESLLRCSDWVEADQDTRSARGVTAVFGARILRMKKGNLGAFSPTGPR